LLLLNDLLLVKINKLNVHFPHYMLHLHKKQGLKISLKKLGFSPC